MERPVEIVIFAVGLALLLLSVVVGPRRTRLRGTAAVTGVLVLAALLVL